nr:nuclear transport factor 2 family protein [uncultured Chryseobacterium sp.]
MIKKIQRLLMLFVSSVVMLSCSDNNFTNISDSATSSGLARDFYQEVIVNKDMNQFNKYIGSTYIQHATGYADGVEPLREELTANASSSNQVQILRVVGDKNYAALHSLWTVGSQQILYVDIWRIENGKLVEHWDQFQNVSENPANSNTMYAGPDTNVNANQNIEQNRARAIAVLNVFDNLNDLSPVENFVSSEYIQHNPTVADGKQAFIDMLNGLNQISYKSSTKIAKTLAFGDMVIVHSHVTDPTVSNDNGTGGMDIFRFDSNGQIVEHWDVLETMTGSSLNNNDPFYYPN